MTSIKKQEEGKVTEGIKRGVTDKEEYTSFENKKTNAVTLPIDLEDDQLYSPKREAKSSFMEELESCSTQGTLENRISALEAELVESRNINNENSIEIVKLKEENASLQKGSLNLIDCISCLRTLVENLESENSMLRGLEQSIESMRAHMKKMEMENMLMKKALSEVLKSTAKQEVKGGHEDKGKLQEEKEEVSVLRDFQLV